MKYLLEFVTCCALPTLHPDDEKSLVLPTTPTPSPTTSQVGVNNLHGSRMRRRVKRPKKKNGGPDWRPSLGAIFEDNTTTETMPPPPVRDGRRRSTTMVASEKDVKRKSNNGGRRIAVPPVNNVNVHPRSRSDRYYRLGLLEKLDARHSYRILRQPSKLELVHEKSDNVRSENPQPMDSQYG
ncbi:hypothetical protein PIB30_034288 [Stylosanthes scabra]|uniref:Uncharacterized protein n=1 Tax=Stylosanthes scabra TaxID=79078 RepID=A0ABU6ZCC2_9FABA|nr:hypothetical protein [Stylosanthes scabra]